MRSLEKESKSEKGYGLPTLDMKSTQLVLLSNINAGG